MIGHVTSNRWSTFIYVLGDNSLLKIFNLCRPTYSDEDEAHDDHIVKGGKWDRERWWYNPAQVCRKWRHLILESASHLGLCLVCSHGTPVADMLAHSPPFPLVIDYGDEDREVTAGDEEGILLALKRRRRVCRIRLWMPASNLRKLIAALDGEFPMLEYLYVKPLTSHEKGLVLPETFKAPRMRHFALRSVTYSPTSMVRLPQPIPRVQSAKGVSQCARCNDPQFRVLLKNCIHVLDDDSLLNIFYFCRPVLVDEGEAGQRDVLLGGHWKRERWWYKLAHVYRRWRYLLFASATHLGLMLLCTYGTPVADMLAHSPPFPLVIDCLGGHRDITAEDEAGIAIALQHRDRVRRIRLEMLVPKFQKIIVAIDEEFPMLEDLYISPPTNHEPRLILPNTLQAPRLRHLLLRNFSFQTAFPLLTTPVGIVTLTLDNIFPSAAFCPNDLIQWLSLAPQLEMLRITFHCPVPNRDIERQLLRMPITTHFTLPHLRQFAFWGASAYFEALVSGMTTPILEKVEIKIMSVLQLNFSIPHLVQFMVAAENLRFGKARLSFRQNSFDILVYSHEESSEYTFYMDVCGAHFDWQVASAAQIFHALRTFSSTVEYLALDSYRYPLSPVTNNEADVTQWRELLMSFSNVKTLYIGLGSKFVEELSRSLQLDNGESSVELLPQLKELQYSSTGGELKAFIDARRKAGRPVTPSG